jgi:DNA-binding MarR family transcriptional regulator
MIHARRGKVRQPKNTKQAQVLAMLRREGGASGPAIAEAMGWAPHTVRGFLAGLSKKGVTRERARGSKDLADRSGTAVASACNARCFPW